MFPLHLKHYKNYSLFMSNILLKLICKPLLHVHKLAEKLGILFTHQNNVRHMPSTGHSISGGRA